MYNFLKCYIKIDVMLIGSWYIILFLIFCLLFIILNCFCVLVLFLMYRVFGLFYLIIGNYI